jgi:phosphate transport system permease protein
MDSEDLRFQRRVGQRRLLGFIFYLACILALFLALASLITLLISVLVDGLPWLSWHFLNNYPSRHPEVAGMKSAIFGSIWLMALTALFTIPLGVGTALYLEEYAPHHWLARIIEVNIANLAGVPSIVYGLLGLAVFVQWLSMGRVLLAGALTMTLLVLPIVIIAAREAIRTVPDSYRQAAYALGASRSQVVWNIVLPGALPGILTGVILAMSRALGEAAPVIAISALVYLQFTPTNPLDRFTVMPIQIFNWVSRPQAGFQGLAAAGIIVLLVVLLSMNSLAIYLRNRFQARSRE